MEQLKKISSVYYYLFFLIMLFAFFYAREQILLKKCSKFFVGEYEESYSVGRGCRTASFKYLVQGEIFHFAECEEKKLQKGDVVFLQVTCNQNGLGRVLWDVPVPDSLTFVPQNGWNSIPYGLDKDSFP